MRKTFTAAALTALVLSSGPAGAGAAPICGDVNDSSKVTTSDALAVLKLAVGQMVTLTCPTYAPPLKTGDTAPYGAVSDGALKTGVAHAFSDKGDGTVVDRTTGLMWEKKDDAGGIHDQDNIYTWSADSDQMNGTITSEFLATLNDGSGFAGHSDWRIPSITELETLRDFGVDFPATSVEFNTACEPNGVVTTSSCTSSNDMYWTSTTAAYTSLAAWGVTFGHGGTSTYAKTYATYARAVRSAS